VASTSFIFVFHLPLLESYRLKPSARSCARLSKEGRHGMRTVPALT
jgi:hypothetical protein